ncbi:MAG: DUF899 domain-containing protein [Hydrogenophaga sp.]|uniref:DUF899 domain-containing protein n=1 Tax=Hydrogenophaga sp. TaxID=1904254 RepID=UPI001D789F82|nr:thioredoxin family protein [Hydrogenophaga sp.]MBX3610875.1 DUF899 domain-containing protein [Hydrogenophaga sp.]
MNTDTDLLSPARHTVVSRDAWLAQRRSLLEREKALTQAQDAMAEARRTMPWVRVEQPYVFDTADGPRSLSDLFEGRRQLLVQHFMLGPGWAQGCPSCSFMADHLDGMAVHLAQRDVSLLRVSRAPLAEIQRFQARMGWQVRWVSSHGNRFNFDYGVSFEPGATAAGEVDYNYALRPFPSDEAPGISVFCRDDAGDVFHTYSTYGRGVEVMMGTYPLLDLTPRGRDEAGLPYTMAWVRHHDRYEPAPATKTSAACCATHG